MPETYELIFDGGSIGNPGRAYGSFRWRTAGGPLSPPSRHRFGDGTNNQAEYKALIQGLQALLGVLLSGEIDSEKVDLILRGDSRLVLKQLAGEWKIKDAELQRLHHQASALIAQFGSVRFIHQDRSETVRVLGH